MKCLTAVLLVTALASASNVAFAQAKVVEDQHTYIYVDAGYGSDSNSGSQSAPLRTISAAADKAFTNNENGIGTRVEINPGTYREAVNIHSTSRQTSATMTFEAVKPGTAIIAASDVISGWQALSGTEYVHSWQDTLTGCYSPSGWPRLPQVVLDAEMVFVNGQMLTQIADATDHRPGTFFVDTSAHTIHIWPVAGTDMYSASVEVSSRRQTITVNQRTNVVLRGLVIEHAGSCMDAQGANVYTSSNILLDNIQAVWNNWGGLGISSSSNITVQNSVGSHNGGVGFAADRNLNVLVQGNHTDYNNWRGAMGSFYDFGMGGIKLMLTHGAQVAQHAAYRNQGEGVWFDTDNKNVTVSNAVLAENLIANLKLEANQGPVSVSNSSFCSSGTGIQADNTAGITVTGSNFYNNGGASKWQGGLFLGEQSGGRSFNDWQTGQYYRTFTTNMRLSGNIFTDAGTGQHVFSTWSSGTPWNNFVGSLHSSSNVWYDPTNPAAFLVLGGSTATLSSWHNLTGQDLNSWWGSSSSAARNCTVPASSYPDFYIQSDNREDVSLSAWAAPYYMSGGSVAINLQVKSYGTGTVALSTSKLPYGVSASFSAPNITTGTSVLTLRAASNAGTETAQITVFGASGSRVHSVTIPVYITP